MKLKAGILMVMFLFGIQSFGQVLLNGDKTNNGKAIVNESFTDFSVSQNFTYLNAERVILENSTYIKLDMGEGFSCSKKVGEAELPVFTYFVEVPFCQEIVVEEKVLEKESFNLESGCKIVPKQFSQSKQNEAVEFVMDKQYYSQNVLGPKNRVEVELLGSMNGVRMAKLTVCPVKYNPVTNVIELAKSLDYSVKFVNPDYEKTLLSRAKTNSTALGFVSNKIMNSKNIAASVHSTNINRPYKMIIVSDRMFESALVPFIQWKTQQGFEVITLYTDEIGNTAADIKTYLQTLWNEANENNPAADYLLLCGDVNKVPTFRGEHTDGTSGHPTDLYYAEYTGDILPDLFYGRFSATSAAQMEAIVAKTVAYEKYAFESDDFLDRILLVAGKETASPAPTCVNGQMNYVKQYFEGLDTSIYYNPASGTKASEIKQKLNNGYAWINYSAHCDKEGWQSPSLTRSNVSTMTNTGMCGVWLNNCCLSGKYDVSECFTEKLLRAENKAAVAAIGASNYTYWYEDFYWSVGAKSITLNPEYNASYLSAYDRMFHTHGESFDKWYTTVGQLVQAGNLAVELSNSSSNGYYWEAYNLMGDPSLTPFVGKGQVFDVNIPTTLPIGTTSLTFDNLPPYTYVGLSSENTLVAAAQADANGVLTLNFDAVESSSLTVVLTNQFYKTLIHEISFVALNEPYVILKDIRFEDASNGESVEVLQANKEYFIHLNAQNIGNQPLTNSVIHIEWLENASITSQYHLNAGTIDAHATKVCDSIFKFRTHEALEDGLVLNFSILLDGHNFQTQRLVKKEIEAPVLDISEASIRDSENSRLIKFTLLNNGKIATKEGTVSIESRSQNISFISTTQKDVTAIAAKHSAQGDFECSISNEEPVSFAITYTADYYSITKVFTIDSKVTIETFENSVIPTDWQNDSNAPWFIDSTMVYEGSYALRSGTINHNGTTSLTISVESSAKDTVSFYVGVSSEQNYDKFKFYLDGVEKLELSGLSTEMELKKYAINAGVHTLRFEYTKDVSVSKNQDAAWIDNLRLPTKAIITSINSVMESQMSLIPNPANKQIQISGVECNGTIFIFDVNGKVMYKDDFTGGANKIINIEHIPAGVYNVCIKSENKLMNQRLIIAK